MDDYLDEGSPGPMQDYSMQDHSQNSSMSMQGEKMEEGKEPGECVWCGEVASKACVPLPFPTVCELLPLPGDYGDEEEDDEISPDLWQEACWIVIRWAPIGISRSQNNTNSSQSQKSPLSPLL